MKDILEIGKYIIPSMVVFLTAYLLIKEFLKREEKKMQLEILLKNQKEIIPVRLQASERLVLFLERIHPESLVIRENTTGLSNVQFQQKLIAAVRTEFEHNLAQQVYISHKSWLLIKAAKDGVLQLINSEAANFDPKDSSISLAKAIIESHMQKQNSPIELAITAIKTEVQQIWT